MVNPCFLSAQSAVKWRNFEEDKIDYNSFMASARSRDGDIMAACTKNCLMKVLKGEISVQG